MIPLAWLPTALRIGQARASAAGRDLWRASLSPDRAPSHSRHNPESLRRLLQDDQERRERSMQQAIATGRTLAGTFIARVVSAQPAGRDARTIVCRRLDDAPLAFAPGQFVTVRAEVAGRSVARNYSLSSVPDGGDTFAFTVREVTGGCLSPYLVRDLAVGETFEVAGPAGQFGLAANNTDAALHWVLIGAGAGVTPLRSVLGALLARPDLRQVDWIGQDRRPEDHLFRSEVEALAAADPRLRTRFLHSRGPGGRRWTTPADVPALPPDAPDMRVLVCGPAGWMETVCTALAQRGVASDRIQTESFARTWDDAESTGQAYTVRLARSQRLLTVRDDQTLLEAAQKAGVPLPFSCAMGGCGACAVRVIEGSSWMPTPHTLSPEEVRRGMVLGCIARPRTPLVLDA